MTGHKGLAEELFRIDVHSGGCLEIAALPFLGGWFGYKTSWYLWLLTWLFAPLGLVGLYASKYGHDRFVEWLLVMPKLDLRL